MAKAFRYLVGVTVLLASWAPAASAATIDFDGVGKGVSGVTFSVAGSPLGDPFTGFAGELNWHWLSGKPADYTNYFYSYCVDATHFLSDPQTVTVTTTDAFATPAGVPDPAAGGRAAWLFNEYAVAAHSSSTGIAAAALQVAIWEAIYDSSNNLSGGTFRLLMADHSAGSVWGVAQGYLGALYAGGGHSSTTTFLDTTSGQDQITASPSAVPEPASMTLLGTGLAAAFFRRRRQRSATV